MHRHLRPTSLSELTSDTLCETLPIYNIGGTDSMQSQTNGIRNLIIKEYIEQKVVVPSLEKQQEISNHIAEMRVMAKRLQEEGESILESAKKEVEQMILG